MQVRCYIYAIGTELLRGDKQVCMHGCREGEPDRRQHRRLPPSSSDIQDLSWGFAVTWEDPA